MTDIPVTKHRCVMAERVGCGEHWYQATAEGHTVGACERQDVATLETTALSSRAKVTAELVHEDGTTRLQLVDSKDEILACTAWTG